MEIAVSRQKLAHQDIAREERFVLQLDLSGLEGQQIWALSGRRLHLLRETNRPICL